MTTDAPAVTFTTDNMVAIGGSRWQRGDLDRVYLNDWARFAGLETTTYNTGNIRSATWQGTEISNSQALKILQSIDKVYAEDGKLHCKFGWGESRVAGPQEVWEAVVSGVRAAIARVFTVAIEVSADGEIWQAVDPAETVGDAYTDDPQQVARDTEANQTYIDVNDDGPGQWRIRVWRGADADTCTAPAAEYYPPTPDNDANAWEVITNTSAIFYGSVFNDDSPGYTVGYIVPAGTGAARIQAPVLPGQTRLGLMDADDTIHVPTNSDAAAWEQGLRGRIADSGRWVIAGPVESDGDIVRVEIRKGGPNQ